LDFLKEKADNVSGTLTARISCVRCLSDVDVTVEKRK